MIEKHKAFSLLVKIYLFSKVSFNQQEKFELKSEMSDADKVVLNEIKEKWKISEKKVKKAVKNFIE